jgi:hypothetical protein
MGTSHDSFHWWAAARGNGTGRNRNAFQIDIELCANLWYNRGIDQRVAPSQPSSQL